MLDFEPTCYRARGHAGHYFITQDGGRFRAVHVRGFAPPYRCEELAVGLSSFDKAAKACAHHAEEPHAAATP